jgi:hypothetical protein
MIDKHFIYQQVLPLIKEKGRLLDYYLIENLFENKEQHIIHELKQYLNKDGGFGHGLEPDAQLPQSNILATSVAINILDDVLDETLKAPLIEQAVSYLEKAYDQELERFVMVPKEVDEYPHAIWWNYKDIETRFSFGNPDPELIGFLYQYRQYVKQLDINGLINKVVTYIKSPAFHEAEMHEIFSVLRFYNRIDGDIKNLIHDDLHVEIDRLLEGATLNENEYGLKPHQIYLINVHYVEMHQEKLQQNLNNMLKRVKELNIMPNWSWGQYDDVFEEVKYQWMGHIYYGYIKALRLHRTI